MADQARKLSTIQTIEQLQLDASLVQGLDHAETAWIIVEAIQQLQEYHNQWH